MIHIKRLKLFIPCDQIAYIRFNALRDDYTLVIKNEKITYSITEGEAESVAQKVNFRHGYNLLEVMTLEIMTDKERIATRKKEEEERKKIAEINGFNK